MNYVLHNKTLDPNIWNEKLELNPKVQEALLQIAHDFYNSTELKGDVQDILFLGSSANYNWTPASDMDLHIVIDVAQQNITAEYARKFMDTLAAKWNTDHKIEIKGHPVEVYLQDLSEPNSTPEQSREGTAIYSLVDKKWLLPPSPQHRKIDIDKIKKKYNNLSGKVKELVATENVNKLKDLMKSIRNYRNAGLLKGGEFSTENLVFKLLRRTGVLTQLKDTINNVYDRGVSLKEATAVASRPPVVDVGRYLIVGLINEHLDIVAGKDYKGDGYFNHETLLRSNPTFDVVDWDTLIHWTYQKRTNTLFYVGIISEMQRYSVLAFLKTKYGITSPRAERLTDWDPSAYKV